MHPRTRSRIGSFLFYIPFALPMWKFFKGSGAKVADLRRDYRRDDLTESEVAATPIEQFKAWFDDAVAANMLEPNAMTLATADAEGKPAARTVLLKGFDEAGFVFFTNYESRKGRHLLANPAASLLFTWLQLERQVEICGAVEPVTREESEAYFYSRPIANQLGAWASEQSSIISGREVLDQRIEALMAQHRGKAVPIPPHWGGYRVIPESIEFWQGRPSRLHDRIRYFRQTTDTWKIERLAP